MNLETKLNLKERRELFQHMGVQVNTIYKTKFGNKRKYMKTYKLNQEKIRIKFKLSHNEYNQVYKFTKDNIMISNNFLERGYSLQEKRQGEYLNIPDLPAILKFQNS